MYIKKNVVIFTVLKAGWKIELLILLTVTASTIGFQQFLKGHVEVSRTIIAVLGTALAFFIGFINNQAYDRWWEARIIWGQLTNDSWSFSRMVGSFIGNEETKKGLIKRHLAFLYALIDWLREENNRDYVKYLKDDEIKKIEDKRNIPAAILNLQGKAIDQAQKDKQLEIFRMAQINEILNKFSDGAGKSIRIKTTVFPPYYKALIRFSIWVFIVLYPMVLSERVGYWAILYSYILGSIFELIYRVGQTL